MRILKIITAVLILGSITIPFIGCAAKSDSSATSKSQAATVQRGNLVVDITGSGNLALSRTEDLPFDLFYGNTQGGTVATVAEVLVEEGDTVKKGQTLASVDTSQWQEQLTTLESQLAGKKRDLVQAEINLNNAETALEDAEALYVWPAETLAALIAAREKVWAAQLEVNEYQAVLRGDTLIYNAVTRTYDYIELKTAWDVKVYTEKLSDAEESLATAQLELNSLLAESITEAKVADAKENLSAAQDELDKLLTESATDKEADAKEIAIQRMKVELAQKELDDVRNDLEGVAVKRLQVEYAQGKLEDAQNAVGDAQKALDEAKSKSPLIIAPFDGFVTQVNVKGGDEIKTGTVAMTIADPTKFETEVLVSEMDIFDVKLGQSAIVQVDAMSTINLSANVTHISPTATVSQGVVNYKVKVEIKSPEAIMQEQQQAMQERQQASENITEQIQQGEFPDRLKQAIEEGRITQEQADEMMKQIQAGGIPFGGGVQGQTSTTQGQRPSSVSGNQTLAFLTSQITQLREGLTVTVSIVVDQKTNVLLVPNKAITRKGQQVSVQVLKDGAAESRTIKTGLSDGTNTEVTEGLSEGEKVVIPQTTTTTTTTSTQRQEQFFIPGMGGR